jgi:hypothetical protein
MWNFTRSQNLLTQLVEGVEFYWVTKFTDRSWWKAWNFTSSQNLLIILQGHQNQWKQWKKSVLAPGLMLGGEGGMAQKGSSMEANRPSC